MPQSVLRFRDKSQCQPAIVHFSDCFIRNLTAQNMQHFASFIVFAFLLANVHGANTSSQQRCTVSSVCGVLKNVLQRQDRLEKKVKEHSAILGGRCTEGKL